jgi:DNA-directed RNA polymerase specialized sigma24 family protein
MTALPNPTSRRRGARSAAATAEFGRLHSQATALARSRWPNLDADDIGRRVVLRFRREREAGHLHREIATWLRSAVYEQVVRDQRADRGDDRHYVELTVLLQELATPSLGRLPSDLLLRAMSNLHPHDIAMLRLTLLGHSSDAVAERLGARPIEVDRAYDRGRARLRAAIEDDDELREALRQVVRARIRTVRYPARRPYPRRPVLTQVAPQVQAPVGAA